MKTVSEKEIKTLVESTVKKLIGLEMMKLRSFLIPIVSEEEQGEIEKIFHKPTRESGKELIVNV